MDTATLRLLYIPACLKQKTVLKEAALKHSIVTGLAFGANSSATTYAEKYHLSELNILVPTLWLRLLRIHRLGFLQPKIHKELGLLAMSGAYLICTKLKTRHRGHSHFY